MAGGDLDILSRRIGIRYAEKAWAAHERLRKQLLRERYGSLITDRL